MDLIQDSQKHLNAMDLRLAALQGATGEWGNPAAIWLCRKLPVCFCSNLERLKGGEVIDKKVQ
jgi:hypothetical protein